MDIKQASALASTLRMQGKPCYVERVGSTYFVLPAKTKQYKKRFAPPPARDYISLLGGEDWCLKAPVKTPKTGDWLDCSPGMGVAACQTALAELGWELVSRLNVTYRGLAAIRATYSKVPPK
jgi:hypothetical protein